MTANPPSAAPLPSRTSALAVVVFVILICSPCLGLGGGLAYLNAESAGRWARWRSLASPPEMAVGFVTADPSVVYVTTATGLVYACNHGGDPAGRSCWQAAEAPYTINSETDFERSVFSGAVPPPPGEVTDVVYTSLIYADAAYEARYALLADGSVWVWEYGGGAYGPLVVLLAGPVLGLALGVAAIVGLLVLNARRRVAPPAASAG
jgi:hypothetical protein